MKKTDTTKLESPQETEELDNEQMEEKAEGVSTVGKRAMVCKTMATIKSRSTFIDTGGQHQTKGRVNISTLVFGNDSLTKPTCKGSSVAQGMLSNQELGPNVSLSVKKG